MIYNAAHTWDDRNSVTGLVLHEHGHFTEVDDLIAETITITGVSEVMNVPGRGARSTAISCSSRVVASSEILIGDQVLCDALS